MSLKKSIQLGILIASIVIVGLLAIVDGYLIVNYQNNLRERIDSSLYESASTVANNIDAINSDLYDIYSYDENYDTLQYSYGLDSMVSIYQLEERLKTLLKLESRSSGYIVFFDNFEQRRYFFNTDILADGDIDELKEFVNAIARTDGSFRTWSYIAIDDRDYAICVYRSGNVALSEIYRLDDVKKDLMSSIEIDGCEVFFKSNGNILGNETIVEKFSKFDDIDDEIFEGYYIHKKQVDGTDLTVYLAVPLGFEIFINAQQIILIFITILCILGAIFLYKKISKQLFDPLEQLTDDMRSISAGNWDAKILSKSRFSEIQLVIDTTDSMIDEIEKQKFLAYEKTIDYQKAQMQYLSLQLKPHFYLNSLKTLNVLAMNGEDEKIQDIIMRLSNHMRYLLTLEKQMVPLRAEIDYVDNYAALQKDMTDRPLKIEWSNNVASNDWLVPNLCIQTFVENSFKYAKLGAAKTKLVVYITINELATDESRLLDLTIRDNGLGYPEELLEALNGEPQEGSENVGINNIKRRCKLIYGSEFECVFTNDNGAVSNLFLPWKDRV